MSVSYRNESAKHKPGSVVISRILVIAYAAAGIFGICMLLSKYTTVGIVSIAIGAVLFIASILYDHISAKKKEKFYSEHPIELFDLFYDKEKSRLELEFSNNKITKNELDARMAELDSMKAELSLNAGPGRNNDPENEKTAIDNNRIIPEYTDSDIEGEEDTFFLDDDDEGTMILEGDAEEEDTLMLFAFEPPKPKFFLIRNSDGEKMELIGSMFTIGSSSSKADYLVTENKKVSRSHATVFMKDKDFYVKDNSKNGTFVNEIKVEKDHSVRLKDGDILSLADEKFTVKIKEAKEN